MSVEVRRADPEDLAALVQLVLAHATFERAQAPAASEALLGAALFGDGAMAAALFAWVAVRDGRVIGYLTATRDFSTWRCAPFLHMDCLYVASGHRGGGVGAALFAALRGFAESAGIAEIQWQTPDWNQDAARFYHRLGAIGLYKQRFTYSLPR